MTSTIINQIENLETIYAAQIAIISEDVEHAEVRHFGGNVFGIVARADFGTTQFLVTYTIEDEGLPSDPAESAGVWQVTVRDEAEDDEIMFEATSNLLISLVGSVGAFMANAS